MDQMNNNTDNIIEIDPKLTVKQRLRKYFHLSTRQVAFMAMIVAFNLVMATFSRFVMGLIPIYGFLVIELTFFTYLMLIFFVNIFYTIAIITICTWIRIPLLNNEWVGTLSLYISDTFALIIILLFKKIFDNVLKIKDNEKKTAVSFLISIVIGTILIAIIDVLVNYILILPLYRDMYGVLYTGRALIVYLAVALGFNILKYFINNLIFMIILKVLFIINRQNQK